MEEWPDISTESLSIAHGPKDTCYAQKCNVWVTLMISNGRMA